MKKTKWIDRKFPPIEDNGILPSIIERLDGTPLRLEANVMLSTPELLILKPDNKWSIKEHIGHLGDLEPLGLGRLDDFFIGLPELRAADMSNRKTDEANYNAIEVSVLLNEFRMQRDILVARLRGMTEKDLLISSVHPRLKTPMRIIDLAFFIAEHDDHHLASISEIRINYLKK